MKLVNFKVQILESSYKMLQNYSKLPRYGLSATVLKSDRRQGSRGGMYWRQRGYVLAPKGWRLYWRQGHCVLAPREPYVLVTRSMYFDFYRNAKYEEM